MMNDRLLFDCETDGLLEQMTVVHSLVLKDVDTGKVYSYHGAEIAEGIERLAAARMIIGHNALSFDVPALQKVYPDFRPSGWVVDTLLVAKLLYSDIKNQADFALSKKGSLPARLIGRHSLEAWGYRLGENKGEYTEWCKAHGIENPWAEWRPEMQTYCEQDIAVTHALFNKLVARIEKLKVYGECITLEHAVRRIIDRQERHGFAFDETKATELHVKLTKRMLELDEQLQAAFPPVEVKTPFIPAANNKSRGYAKGVLTYKTRVEVFNASSRPMIASRLKERYGWTATEFTDGGEPKIDESVLEGMPWPEAALLNERFLVEKRLAALANGKQAWLKVVRNGSIHGRVDTLGTVTGRMTHSNPNVAQVPSGRAAYGEECRELFRARPGYTLVGCDADALELRCLAHYMARYDGGAYTDTVLNGDKAKGTDMHSVNARAIGLDPTKQYPVGAGMSSGRDIAKTFFYAFAYGAGSEKLGTILGNAGDEAKKVGARLRGKFLTGLPALGALITDLTKAAKRGYLVGLDGRPLPIRSSHAALNTLLQSAGAVLMKKALVILEGRLASVPLHFGSDYAPVANVHDEFQIEVKHEYAERVGHHAVAAIREAGLHFGFRCPLDGQFAVGETWAETH